MLVIGPLGFALPWLLAALIALPILWFLLRAIPPRPIVRKFPAVMLLLGLDDREMTPIRTPWWLLLLRITALAAVILGFAGPFLNPERDEGGTGPLLVLTDGDWASAPDWAAHQARLGAILDRAAADGRAMLFQSLTEPLPAEAEPVFRLAADWEPHVAGLKPEPWPADRAGFAAWLQGAGGGSFETIWLTSGLQDPADAALFAELQSHGQVSLVASGEAVFGLATPTIRDGALVVRVLRSQGGGERNLILEAHGTDPNGIERILGQVPVAFDVSATEAEAALAMPVELRNRVGRLVLRDEASAGAVQLLDDGSRRRKVGLMAGAADREGQQYVSPLFYIRKALAPQAELVEAPLGDLLRTSADVLIMADVGAISDSETEALVAWVEKGGLLVRFSGPRLARSTAAQLDADPLLPVRLRAGGRDVSGAMAWGEPKRLQDFPESSAFAGLAVPDDVTVTSQVVAQPDPELSGRALAVLEDGTPLVTSRNLGEGRIVLFHVTANAEWSNLPLSGLFVQMLERLAVSARSGTEGDSDLAGQVWTAEQVLDGFGNLSAAPSAAGVEGEILAQGMAGRATPPGLWRSGDRLVAVNLISDEAQLVPMQAPPPGVELISATERMQTDLKPWLLAAAILMLAADIMATLLLGGRLPGRRAAQAAMVLLALATGARDADAADSEGAAMLAANNSVLAYIRTGDEKLDATSHAGLRGLSRILAERTSIEPIEPVGLNPETDEMAFYPFIYWPISESQAPPSDEAVARLNTYLRNGGLLMFDTRDADLGAAQGPNGQVLQRIAARLDIPPLEPIPADHVLTRTFYLLQDFPGRWTGAPVWVEASASPEQVEGMPFRNLNDGVTPVIIGANDWAAAWALSEDGVPMFPVGRGVGGEHQREIAWRFGVNIIMHVMTGNYKSDQVHVPALLERLGQ